MEMRPHTYADLSANGPPDVENVTMEMTSPVYADINAIERQEFPGTHDAYTVVDKTKKKTPKPEDHLPSYQVRRVQGLSLRGEAWVRGYKL